MSVKKANQIASAFEKSSSAPAGKKKAPPFQKKAATDTCSTCGQPMPAEKAADLKAADND